MKNSRSVLAAGAVLALGLAACSSSGSASKDTGSKGSGAKGTPITIYNFAPENIAAGASQPGVQQAMRAVVSYYNNQGGINGHPIKFAFCNDQEDANATTQCAQDAVRAKAAAVIDPYANLPVYLPVLQAAGIPVIDGLALNSGSFSAPNNYLISAGALGLSYGLGDVAKQAKYQKVAVIASQLPATKPITEGFIAAARSSGVDIAKQVEVPGTLSDLSSIVAQVGQVDAAFLLLPPGQVLAYLQAAKQSGTKVPLMSSSGLLQSSQIEQTGGASSPAENAIISNFYPNSTSSVWDGFRQAIAQYSGSKGQIDLDNSAVQGAWVTMKVFVGVARSIQGDVTSASFTSALSKATAVDTGGATPPLNFTQPLDSKVFPRLFNRTVYFPAIKGGKFAESGLAPIDTTRNFRTAGG